MFLRSTTASLAMVVAASYAPSALGQAAPRLSTAGDQAAREVRENWRAAGEEMRSGGREAGAVRASGADADEGAAGTASVRAGGSGRKSPTRTASPPGEHPEYRRMVCFIQAMAAFEEEEFPTVHDAEIAALEERIKAIQRYQHDNLTLDGLDQIQALSRQQGKLKGLAHDIRQPRMEAAAARKCGGSPKEPGPTTAAPAPARPTTGPSDAAIEFRARELVKKELETDYRTALDKLNTAAKAASAYNRRDPGLDRAEREARAAFEQAERDYRAFLKENAPEEYAAHMRESDRINNGALVRRPSPAGGTTPVEPPSDPLRPPALELAEYDGPAGPGDAGSPEERALRETIQQRRQTLDEARARLAEAQAGGDAAEVAEAREIYDQAHRSVIRSQDAYRDYMRDRPQVPDE